jgi:hypothetical protein
MKIFAWRIGVNKLRLGVLGVRIAPAQQFP